MIAKIFKYQLHDVLRSRWIIFYLLLFFSLAALLGKFAEDPIKIFISLINVELVFVPLVSIIYGTTYFYNSREYITFLLTQPIKRKDIFIAMYLSVLLPLVVAPIIGTTLPILFFINKDIFQFFIFMNLNIILSTAIFTAISFLISIVFEDKSKGLGVSILIWIFFSIIYDGIFLLGLIFLNDYPIELPALIFSMINPIDLGRIMVLLKTDISILMGYTGAVFNKFFGSNFGTFISFLILVLWATIPFYFGLKKFKKIDF